MIGQDPYYSRTEVSNSDLGALENYFMPPEYVLDAAAAYRFGNLIDAMITEPHRCDHYALKVDQEAFAFHEWAHAQEMKKAFFKHPLAASLHKMAGGQAVKTATISLEHHGLAFELEMRCKYDLWMPALGWGADIKSTTATTQKQFEDACRYFNYDRQRATYMNISKAKKDLIIGISKANLKVFTLAITHGDDFHTSGTAKLQEAAFRYWQLFGDIKTTTP